MNPAFSRLNNINTQINHNTYKFHDDPSTNKGILTCCTVVNSSSVHCFLLKVCSWGSFNIFIKGFKEKESNSIFYPATTVFLIANTNYYNIIYYIINE